MLRMTDIEKRVRRILIEVLELDAYKLPVVIDVDRVETWDSLEHLNLIEALGKEFGISIEHAVSVELLSEEDILTYLKKAL